MKKITCKGPVIEFLPLYIIKDGFAYMQQHAEEKIDKQFLLDFEEDFPHLINELEEVKLKRIKRYKKIVDILKEAYNGKCQICGMTFEKDEGKNYSEGHHLNPLAKGGTQEKDNVIIICATHHRMFHYAKEVVIYDRIGNIKPIVINGNELSIRYHEY